MSGLRLVVRIALASTLGLLVAGCTLPDDIRPSDLRSFTSDACSRFPEGTAEHQNLWCKCCLAHDKSYWQGGTSEERARADQALEQCVAEVGEPRIAKLMLAGVRVGGTPYLWTEYRWGYGWPYLRGYRALTPGERAAVAQRLAEPGARAVEAETCPP